MAETSQFDRSMQAALAAAQMGRLGDAREILERAAEGSGVNDGFFALYLDVLEAQGDWRALDGAAKAWHKLAPNRRTLEAQAKAAWESGLLTEALQFYREALRIGEPTARRLGTFARLCINATEYEEADRVLAEAERLDPNDAQVLSARAGLLLFAGQFEAAEAYCRRALAADPDDVASYRVLGELKRGRLDDSERQKLLALSHRNDLKPELRISAAFTLGDAYDAEGDIDAAFAAYELAHREAQARDAREGLRYDPDNVVRNLAHLKSLFPRIPSTAPQATGPRPIFIVGMPRSGTTLIESVLAAHSRVAACGERMVMRQIRREYLWLADHSREATAETRANFVKAYFDRLPPLGAADHITDKNPWNFDAVGLILALLPNAHVIHVRRNPVENGLSIYRKEFPKFQAYTQRLDHIGRHYGLYAELMAHWTAISGSRLTTVQYEDFVRDFDTTAPALLAACGLEWEQACRDFQTSSRRIATLSAVQAREAVRDRSGRAERYAQHLGPLVEALEAASVDLVTGEWRGAR